MQGPNKGMPGFYVGVKKDLHTVTCQSPMCYRHVKVSAFLRLEEQLTVAISKNTYTDSQSIYTEWLSCLYSMIPLIEPVTSSTEVPLFKLVNSKPLFYFFRI
jgi:hypothetical protein